MAIYFAKPAGIERLKPGENVHIWFNDSELNDCNNALVLYGGDVLLLKTVERINRSELVELVNNPDKWAERFGTGLSSDELRSAVRQSYEVNIL